MIELTCLGPPQVRVDGADAPVELLWRKHLALLIYLARSPRGRAREHLIGILWGDKDESKARHSLNEALRVLRRVLGDALESDGTTVRIAPGAVHSDLESLSAERIGGDFLEGFTVPDAPEFEDWLTAERHQVRVAALDLLVASGERALSEGRPSVAREAAERSLRLDPHHEPAARLLMRVHALNGARAAAVEVFERLRAGLDRDVGIPVAQETRDLADRIVAERIVRGAPPAGAPVERLPLAGAGSDRLAALTALWRTASAGAARLAVIRGDPGTGKTRLIEELASRARLDGAIVGLARAIEEEASAATLGAIFRHELRVPELSGVSPAALAGLAGLDPDLAIRFPAARSAQPLALSDAWLAAVGALCESRPVLLALDDAHRADAATLGVLTGAVERVTGARLFVVLAGAAAPAIPALDRVTERIGRDMPGAVVSTTPFVESDVRELIALSFPEYDPPATDRLARRVMADTAGNPFLAVELITAVRGGLRVGDEQQGVWPAAQRTLDQTLPADLPGTVGAALRLRFKSLTPGAQAALAAVAALGGTLALEALARAAELSRDDLDRALDELEWQRWLVGDGRGYRFVTRIAREVILADMITGGQRRRMRERAGIP